MIRYRCDACAEDLARDGSNHFILKIEAFAAAGTLEFTKEDIERDHRRELNRLIDQLNKQSPDEIENQVYRALRFDLCPACHRRFLKAPLANVADSGPRSRT